MALAEFQARLGLPSFALPCVVRKQQDEAGLRQAREEINLSFVRSVGMLRSSDRIERTDEEDKEE